MKHQLYTCMYSWLELLSNLWYRDIELPKCVYLASMGVKIDPTVGVQNKVFFLFCFFQNAYLMVMSTETLPTTKVKIAKVYALVRWNLNDIHGKFNKIEFCYKFCRIWPLGRLAAIIIDILLSEWAMLWWERDQPHSFIHSFMIATILLQNQVNAAA